jgi:small ligand-binding sensory domain FIST
MIRATPFLFHEDGNHGMGAGVRIGQRLMHSRGSQDLILVWPDPFKIRPDRLLQALDATLDGVPVAGGAASARELGPGNLPVLRRGNRRGSRLRSEARGRVPPPGHGHAGLPPLADPMQVTRAHENLVLEVEGRPALEVLRELVPDDFSGDPHWAIHGLFAALLPERRERVVRPGEYLVPQHRGRRSGHWGAGHRRQGGGGTIHPVRRP